MAINMNRIIMSDAQHRFRKLLGFLAADPNNNHLILEAAEAALDACEPDQAVSLLARLAMADAIEERAANLAGLAALRQGRSAEAIAIFSRLLSQSTEESLRLNLAWAYLLANDHQAVLATLDRSTATPQPAALRLRVLALHNLGRLEEALLVGDYATAQDLDNPALFGALSSVALDSEDNSRARAFALRAANHPDGVATIGMLALAEGDSAAAAASFDKALASQSDHARATIGRALLFLGSDATVAAKQFERGAELFGSHLGSWIAAGWACFIIGDTAGARRNFERARALDDTFSEVHGGLAVVEILEGELDRAREQMRIALRLDGQSLGGRLAQMMLLERAGKPDAAAAILRKALGAPLGPNGQTLQQALAGFTRVRS